MDEAAPTRMVMGEVSCANTFGEENSNELANIPNIAFRLVVILSPVIDVAVTKLIQEKLVEWGIQIFQVGP
jgi:hypothetical protein